MPLDLCLVAALVTPHAPGLGDLHTILERKRAREAKSRVLPQAEPHGASGFVDGGVPLFQPQLLDGRHRAHEDRRLANLLLGVVTAQVLD